MSKAGLKAGLVGGAVMFVLQLIGLIPCAGCFTWILGFAAYAGAGVLAAYWLPTPRSAGDGAGAGAIAGILSGVIGGIFGMILSGIQFALTDSAAIMSQIPQESLDAMREAGMNPEMFASAGFVLLIGSLCCVIGMVIAAVLGAIGGAIFASVQSE